MLSFSPETLNYLVAVKRMVLRTLSVMLGVGVLVYQVKVPVLAFLTAPLLALPHPPQMMVTGVTELFFVYMKVCTWAAIFVGVPWLFFEVWRFVAPALYPAEKRTVLPMLLAVPLLFYGGAVFAWMFIIPVALAFFFGFTQPGVAAQPMLVLYLGFVGNMALAFGLAFNLPTVLLLLLKVGLVQLETLRKMRRLVVVLVFVAAAILTPPDPLSQILMAIPLWGLYELAIWIADSFGIAGRKTV